MTHRPFAFALVLALPLAIAACGAADATSSASSTSAETNAPPDAGPGFDWPVPAHWAPETIPFPLDFAPALPYTGVEELRFMQHFFDPAAENYFSYSFAWLLDQPKTLGAEQLNADLTTYFSGLAQSADPTHFDATAHHAELALGADGHYRGVVKTADGFNASAPLQLNADIELTSCGARTVMLFTFSPHPTGDATWTTLLDQRATFRCTR